MGLIIYTDHITFQDKGQVTFEDKWPSMRPIVLKLLKQEPVTQTEWQDLFVAVHSVCLWDERGPYKLRDALQQDIMMYIKQAQARVLAQREDQALLKAYIAEWGKFFTQCNYLPTPFRQLESSINNISKVTSSNTSNSQKKNNNNNIEDSLVRKLMLDSWNQSIFMDIKQRLQDSAMKLVQAERNGESFDSQLVIGVRESYGMLLIYVYLKLKSYEKIVIILLIYFGSSIN